MLVASFFFECFNARQYVKCVECVIEVFDINFLVLLVVDAASAKRTEKDVTAPWLETDGEAM